MKEKIEKIIEELEENYSYYLKARENINYRMNWYIIDNRIHDLYIEINAYKRVLEMLENECIRR